MHVQNSKLKIFAGILSVLMIVVVLFSGIVIALEAEHDCKGEECDICLCIEQCIFTLEQLGKAIGAAAAVLAKAVIFILAAVVFRFYEIPGTTPITDKVRLNN